MNPSLNSCLNLRYKLDIVTEMHPNESEWNQIASKLKWELMNRKIDLWKKCAMIPSLSAQRIHSYWIGERHAQIGFLLNDFGKRSVKFCRSCVDVDSVWACWKVTAPNTEVKGEMTHTIANGVLERNRAFGLSWRRPMKCKKTKGIFLFFLKMSGTGS